MDACQLSQLKSSLYRTKASPEKDYHTENSRLMQLAMPPPAVFCGNQGSGRPTLHRPRLSLVTSHLPPAESVGNQVGRVTRSLFGALGALDPIGCCPTGVAAIDTANL